MRKKNFSTHSIEAMPIKRMNSPLPPAYKFKKVLPSIRIVETTGVWYPTVKYNTNG